MSYIPSDIINKNNNQSIDKNNIFDNIQSQSQPNNKSQNINANINMNNNINNDQIQEQFKLMSERYKQRKLKEKENQNTNSNKHNNNINEKNDNNKEDKKENNKENDENKNNNKENNEENNEDKKNNNEDYIKIIESDIDIQFQHKNHLLNLIFNDYTVIFIQYYNHKLKLRSLITQDSEEAYKNASNYPENQFYSMYQLFILSYALLEIDDYIFSNPNECLEFLYKLPYKDINKLYTVFYENIKNQNQIINNLSYFYDLVNEPFFRMKYKVMKAFNCLPTEQRCRQLNDAQWLWLYYNLEEDMFEKIDETQDNLDYIGFYLNSDAAKKIMKHNQAYRKKRDQKRKARFATSNDNFKTENNIQNNNEQKNSISTNQVLDNFFTSTPITNDNTVYNTNFEKELTAAVGTTDISKFTEISDDNEAGNPFESEEDFLERLQTFAPVAGTNYGYVKPEKPPKLRIARKENYVPNSNVNNETESRIEHYLRNTVKQHNFKTLNVKPLPVQKDLKSINNNIQNNNNISLPVNNQPINNKSTIPLQNKQIDKTQINNNRKQQADLDFMHKMNITSLQEMDNFKTIQNDKNVDFIEFEEDD